MNWVFYEFFMAPFSVLRAFIFSGSMASRLAIIEKALHDKQLERRQHVFFLPVMVSSHY